MSQSEPQVVILIQHDVLHSLFSHPTGLKTGRERGKFVSRGLLLVRVETKLINKDIAIDVCCQCDVIHFKQARIL